MAVMCGGLPTDAPCYSPGAVSPSLTVKVTDSSSRYSLRRSPAIQGSVGPQTAMAVGRTQHWPNGHKLRKLPGDAMGDQTEIACPQFDSICPWLGHNGSFN